MPLSSDFRSTTYDSISVLSESSPYFPVIPQVVQTERDDENLLISQKETDDEQDVALIIKDKLTNIFNLNEQGAEK